MSERANGANALVEGCLTSWVKELEKILDADCLTYIGPIAFGADDDIREAVESLSDKRKKLVFETPGGFAETARRISDILRHHYDVVDFLVPSYAMSAGTILALSGDAIHMDYYSVLGPIDPQVQSSDGKRMVPALGYLIRYEELINRARQGAISTAEMEILLSFDQGMLYAYEQARDLSISLLVEWLVKYKFKDWDVTDTRGLPVTEAMKDQRAREIAAQLNDVKLWNSHGIGISMARLRQELNLRIDDFGEDAALNELVRKYHRLLTDYFGKMRFGSVVHTRDKLYALS